MQDYTHQLTGPLKKASDGQKAPEEHLNIQFQLQ